MYDISIYDHHNDRTILIDLFYEYYNEQTKFKFIGDKSGISRVVDSDYTYSTTILIKRKDTVVGFIKCVIDNQDNLVEDYLYVEFMYIKKEYRNTAITAYTFTVISEIQKLNGGLRVILDAMITDANNSNVRILKPKLIGNTYELNFDNKIIDKYSRRYFENI